MLCPIELRVLRGFHENSLLPRSWHCRTAWSGNPVGGWLLCVMSASIAAPGRVIVAAERLKLSSRCRFFATACPADPLSRGGREARRITERRQRRNRESRRIG